MRILIPVNEAPACRRAVEFIVGRTEALTPPSALEIVTVREPVPVSFFSNVTRDTMDRYYEECAEEVFESVRKVLEPAAVRASFVHLKAADTAEAIAGEAVKVGADLIVAGKRSHADTPHEKGDGTLSSVISKAQCPVLVLRSDRVPGKGPLRVGIAVDGSRFGFSAVSFIASHLPLFGTGAHFTLMHAVREGLSPEATQEAVRSATETLKPLLERHGIEADLMAPQGEVADAVVRAAADLELDMLVLGAHGYGSLNTALGSAAAAIAAKSDLPLLIIR